MYTERVWKDGPIPLNVAATTSTNPPLLLLHNVGRRWRCFDPILAPLASTWQVHALDLRGHGLSRRADSYLAVDQVGDVRAYLTEMVQGQAVLYGHATGGLTALGVAAALPERVRAVVLEDPPSPAFLNGGLHDTFYDAGLAVVQRLAGCGRSVAEMEREISGVRVKQGAIRLQLGEVRHALFVRFLARCLADLDPAAISPVIEGQWLTGFDLEAAADAVRCPVLLVRADESKGGMLSRAEADHLAGRFADCTYAEIAGCGNLIHWLEPESLMRYVLGFLGSL